MKCKNCVYYMPLTVATLLVTLGIVMLARTFALYNDLFLVRQDRQTDELLMHRWMGQNYITEVEMLTEENGDVQGMNKMLECLASGKALTASYQLSYPSENDVHAMRITVRPLQESTNGYFVVALTSDYDEVIRPMQNAAIRLIAYGCMVVVGVLLCGFLALKMFRRSRHRDQELQKLILKNEQTRQLLEKTQALAHHQRLETIGTLASSIAHEFNNLLTPIMGYAILTLEELPEEADDLAENITEIYEASRKAKTIVNRLGELSRKNAEQTFRRLQLEALCIKAIQVAAPALPAHVKTILKCEEDCCVMGNEVQLSQLLLNLILNAYHAMEEHGGTLTLHIAREAEKAVLTVADTGIGISKEVLPKIFDPFFTTKGSGKGTGLGLAIARQVAEGHQGQISVTSQEGEGTVFTIFLPLAETALPENS